MKNYEETKTRTLQQDEYDLTFVDFVYFETSRNMIWKHMQLFGLSLELFSSAVA